MKTNTLLGIIATALILITLKLFGATFSGILITLVIGAVLLVLTAGFWLSACLAIDNSFEKHSWWKYVIATMVGWFILLGIPMIVSAEVFPSKLNSWMLMFLNWVLQSTFTAVIFWIVWYVVACVGVLAIVDAIEEERRFSKIAKKEATS